MSLKALLNYVLEEVAIDGEEGTKIDELFHHVNNFYIDNPQARHNVYELDMDVITSPSFRSVTKSISRKDVNTDTEVTMDIDTSGNPQTEGTGASKESEDNNENAEGNGNSSQPKDSDKPAVSTDGDTTMTDADGPNDSQSQAPTNSQPPPQPSQPTFKNSGNDSTWGLPNVKEEFQEYVWDLLRQQKDFLVGPKNEWGHLSLKEVVEMIKARRAGSAGAEGLEQEQELRVYATLDRRWRALTGHGPNPKKVPNAVFQCLTVIAKFREKGLIQPELTAITGQDKKSVAGRTTTLRDLGYIEKVNVLARSMNTSKLTLMKFAISRDRKKKAAAGELDDEGLLTGLNAQELGQEGQEGRGNKIGAPAAGKGKAKDTVVGGNERWTGENIHVDSLVHAIVKELKKARNGVIQRGDLKKKLGMDKSRFHWRSLSRILRKVETFGLWKRIRVPLPKKHRNTVGAKAHARCIKLMRDLTDDDLRRLVNAKCSADTSDSEGGVGGVGGGGHSDDGGGGSGNKNRDNDAEDDPDLELDEDAAAEIADLAIAQEGGGNFEEKREVPQWSPHHPIQNIVQEIVDASGKDGVSSMELGHRAVGPFYYRPMDQVLHRITDFPARSQPLMYIDLAVIRETSITHRQTHYHYFSYRWHQELVKKGLANEPWSTASKKKKGSKNLSQSEEVPCKELLLDSFGFPKTDPTRLFKIDGTATLQDCHILVTEKENIITNIPSSKWTIATGSYGNGRPRKYEKGKEPYLEGKRRREQREREILEAIERGEIPPYTSADGRARGKRKAEVLGDMNGGEEMLKRPRGRPKGSGKSQKAVGKAVGKGRGRKAKVVEVEAQAETETDAVTVQAETDAVTAQAETASATASTDPMQADATSPPPPSPSPSPVKIPATPATPSTQLSNLFLETPHHSHHSHHQQHLHQQSSPLPTIPETPETPGTPGTPSAQMANMGLETPRGLLLSMGSPIATVAADDDDALAGDGTAGDDAVVAGDITAAPIPETPSSAFMKLMLDTPASASASARGTAGSKSTPRSAKATKAKATPKAKSTAKSAKAPKSAKATKATPTAAASSAATAAATPTPTRTRPVREKALKAQTSLRNFFTAMGRSGDGDVPKPVPVSVPDMAGGAGGAGDDMAGDAVAGDAGDAVSGDDKTRPSKTKSPEITPAPIPTTPVPAKQTPIPTTPATTPAKQTPTEKGTPKIAVANTRRTARKIKNISSSATLGQVVEAARELLEAGDGDATTAAAAAADAAAAAAAANDVAAADANDVAAAAAAAADTAADTANTPDTAVADAPATPATLATLATLAAPSTPTAPITRSLRKRKAATSPPRQLETPVKRGRAAGKKQDKDKQQEKQKQLEKQKEQKEQKEQEKEKQQEKQKDAQDTEDAEDAATTATAATTAMDTAMEIDLLKDMDKDGNEDRDVVMVDTEIVTGGLRSSGEDKGLENNEAGEGNAGGDMDVDEAGTGDKGVDRGDDKEAPPSSQPDAPFAVDDVVVEPDNLAADHESYGSIGGMLALGRQQIVLDLVSTHHGVFPGGNELRHAFNYEYRKKNPKAGEADRRLIRGVVQALQYKGKINQFSFTIQTARGVMVKKLLVAKEVSIDHPLVIEAIRQMKAADCNLWYPEGTDLPPSVQARVGTSVTWVQAPPSAVEETEFDRMYPSLTQTKKTEKATARAIKNQQKAEDRKMRAELKRMKQLGGTLSTWSGKFTEEQRQEALRRKSELKIKIEKLRTKFANPAVEESEEEPSGPRTIWWNDFVQRPPPDANAFLKDVEDVNNVELMQGEELFDSSQTKNGKLVMINHFGPAIETKGNNKPMSLDNQISKKLNKDGSQHLSPNKKASAAAQNTPTTSAEALMEDPSKPQKKRRKRPAGSKAPTNSRRQKAMEELHKVTGLEAIADEQSELPNRTVWTHRNKYTIPREDEDTLLIAVIIVRTLFGNIDRKINWNLIQKAMPQHDTIVFQRRWPRVREMHKTHLKRLQTEFEEMYLQAYAEGHLPRLDMDHPMEFDIRWHIKWFRDNLELPEPNLVPELCGDRRAFDKLYNLRVEKEPTWRVDYHNPNYTMGNRANHFVCYAYELPVKPAKRVDKGKEKAISEPNTSSSSSSNQNTDPEDDEPTIVSYVQSIIKANIMTDASTYDPMSAFHLIRSQPEDAVDEAFFSLSNAKVIAHKKHNRIAPGRNYELTDKFHLSLRTPMDEKLLAQGLKFDQGLRELLLSKESVELSPFVNDGSVACVMDLVANRRVVLRKGNFKTSPWGLVDGYETRSMAKHLVDFQLFLTPTEKFNHHPRFSDELPPIPTGNLTVLPVQGNMGTEISSQNPLEPIRIWIDMNHKIIKGMWLRVTTAVLSLVNLRPGITVKEMSRMLAPGLMVREVADVVDWLRRRGAVRVVDNGTWPIEGFYRALEGM